MKKVLFSAVLGAVLSLTSCAQEKQEHLLNVVQFEQQVASDQGQLLDVRTPKEFEAGTIEGAVNIDFLDSEFAEQIEVLDKDKPLYIFCKSGGRSAKAMRVLKDKGFDKVYELKGGYTAWEETKK